MHTRTSESFRLGAVLAVAGGFMDAYSYICRGGVFANAQTGNILLLGVNIYGGNWSAAARYGAPVIAFSAGIVIAEFARLFSEARPQERKTLLHWRQLSLFLEMLFLIGVCFIPQDLNLLANSITSLACGMQVESFRTIHGNGIATTMCIGNLRSGTENLCNYIHRKDTTLLNRALLYFGIILCFVAGAVLGDFAIARLGEKALLVCALVLLLAFMMLFSEKESAR